MDAGAAATKAPTSCVPSSPSPISPFSFRASSAKLSLLGKRILAASLVCAIALTTQVGKEARLIQPLLALTGEIRSLKLEVWIAVPGGFVVAYNFQVELAGARVLDADLNQVRADQAVTWTYQLTPSAKAQPIPWPIDAPAPDAFPVPGFALGTFPIPPNTELLAFVGGVPDLMSTQTPVQLDSFFRTELFALGWDIEGEGNLLRCSKAGANFQLLISADSVSNGTRISILPGE